MQTGECNVEDELRSLAERAGCREDADALMALSAEARAGGRDWPYDPDAASRIARVVFEQARLPLPTPALPEGTPTVSARRLVIRAEFPNGLFWPHVPFPMAFDEVLCSVVAKQVKPITPEVFRALPLWPLPLVRYSPDNLPIWVASAARSVTDNPTVCEWRAAGDRAMIEVWLRRIDRVGVKRKDDGTCPVWTVEDDGPYTSETLAWVAEYGRPIPEAHAEASGIEWNSDRTMTFRLNPPYWGDPNIRVTRLNENPGWADQVTVPIP